MLAKEHLTTDFKSKKGRGECIQDRFNKFRAFWRLFIANDKKVIAKQGCGCFNNSFQFFLNQ